ncbi:NAD(+) synthetase [Candidatus Roizmanbacteria bacterium CG22_combo_CG10-13_8_21_14_all_38_20]|uniref:NH(3)-dependent NAD(+) synthetase n=1 Tax=Candidatus Roizmanbacteria bacterium CG22_combo_CG10-13_8_21_14_all_38_20 TaxID=1974862 RepID=A0A2H0BVM6_9BACT|nr:MAG: NAD(+) synthetase [Candidatus Roizmanbacteria bacterium CG22_combo_CG10-13_8_21_14_all_38_20]PJC32403.1 MAG: NAD(+) synthetase [Candidatus Roizmanbacteria bacterium CG_4_9_14_0_2_um_filter_38_17]
MYNLDMLNLNSQQTAKKIEEFIKNTLKSQGFKRVVVGVSGGIDSATALALATKALGAQNVHVISMPYGNNGKQGTVSSIDIKPIVDSFNKPTRSNPASSKLRLGNIMARVRMIILYDYAKKNDALVCGTENRSEYYLGYFTRFGDEASDLEPLIGLYKTQVRQLAKYLNVSKAILDAQPTAELWEGQTDEQELGFSYESADPIIYLYCDKKISADKIVAEGHNPKLVKKVVDRVNQASFKHLLPFTPPQARQGLTLQPCTK